MTPVELGVRSVVAWNLPMDVLILKDKEGECRRHNGLTMFDGSRSITSQRHADAVAVSKHKFGSSNN